MDSRAAKRSLRRERMMIASESYPPGQDIWGYLIPAKKPSNEGPCTSQHLLVYPVEAAKVAKAIPARQDILSADASFAQLHANSVLAAYHTGTVAQVWPAPCRRDVFLHLQAVKQLLSKVNMATEGFDMAGIGRRLCLQ
jgi:hypothetical protein